MKQKKVNLKSLLKHVSATFMVLLFLVSSLSFGSGVTQAAASCRSIINPPQAGAFQEDPPFYVGYTPQYVVPSWSSCHDINISGITSMNGDHCGTFRVRFFPSSGGNYANSWKTICSTPGSGEPLQVVASDVLDGTVYRVEYPTVYTQPFYTYKIWD